MEQERLRDTHHTRRRIRGSRAGDSKNVETEYLVQLTSYLYTKYPGKLQVLKREQLPEEVEREGSARER